MAKIVAELVKRGEEDLAEELLHTVTSARIAPDAAKDVLKMINDEGKKAIDAMKDAGSAITGMDSFLKGLLKLPEEQLIEQKVDKKKVAEAIKRTELARKAWRDIMFNIGLNTKMGPVHPLRAKGSPNEATAQFSTKIKGNLLRAAKRTGGKLTGGGWNQIQVTFSFDSEKDARRFHKSAENADPDGWASPDEPYEQKGQWHVDVNG
jgi:hypothetical protein